MGLNSKIKQHIFIPGNVRSGTTWVTAWLSSHPDIACYRDKLMRHKMNSTEQPRDIKAFLDSVFEHNARGKSIALLSAPGDICFKEQHVSHLIHSIYDNAYVLILYRDGKNWVHSLMNLPWKTKPRSLQYMVNLWITKIQAILSSTPKNTIHIKYEDMLYNNAYKEILNFLNIEHVPIVAWQQPYSTKWSQYNPDRWKNMSTEHLKIMEKMNPWLEKAGYETV